MSKWNLRQNFTRRAALGCAAALAVTSAQPSLAAQKLQDPPAPPPIASSLVKEFVVKGHGPNIEIMRDLLKQEPKLIHASWDWTAGDTETALQAAAHTGRQQMARFLLDQGARVDLFAAAMLGEFNFVKLALDVFPRALSVPGAHGIPLLNHAISGNTPAAPVVDYLLAKGADVNARQNNGVTALIVAVSVGRIETVRQLLDKGADPTARALSGITALSLSLKNNQTEIAAFLRKAGAIE